MSTIKFELLEVITTSKNGRLSHKKKSIGQYTALSEMAEAVKKEKIKKTVSFIIVDFENKKEIKYNRIRKNYHISTVDYTGKPPKKAPPAPKKYITPNLLNVQKFG
jgi:hypothetical protein